MNQGSGDEIDFAAEEPVQPESAVTGGRWKLLIVDDDAEIHAVTALALSDFHYEGQPLTLLHAYTGLESIAIMREQPDVAIILMDVVMETDHAGLDAVHAIRVDQKNALVRIVLRTGQPGQAPEREIVTTYDINDYKEKTELTSRKLFTMVYTILGYYRQLLAVESHRAELQKIVEELRRSNRDLNEYAYIAAHDLATPLRSIVGFSQLLEKRFAESLPEQAREYLEFIVQSTRRMKGLIDDLLTIAQVGRRNSLPDISLDSCLDGALLDLHDAINSSGAEIRRAPLPSVLGVQTELRQLLMNLIGNAIKFCKPDVNPIVAIDAGRVGDAWELRVSDNGIGIAAEQRNQLFHLFRRLHHAEQYEGTGVGLALCRKIAEGHGGSIRIEDSPLGGASFVVTLVQ